MTTFDEAIPRLLAICCTGDRWQIGKACLVRDLAGRLRLAVEDLPVPDAAALEKHLQAALGGYFAGPILTTADEPARRSLARAVLDQGREWPTGWPDSYPLDESGGIQRIDPNRWLAAPRTLAKEAWLDQPGQPPWPLGDRTPTIVSFHSFKGGVGRTTLLALCARNLANRGHSVVLVDLDLEAPGLGELFDVQPVGGRGVLDHVVDHIALDGKQVADVDIARAAALDPEESTRLGVLPVGRLGWSHLEKLGRLDYAASGLERSEPSPVQRALTDLLRAIKRTESPDFIFLDARSGLHELGGLSLHALAHIDVLVTRDGPQSRAGLAIVLEALARRSGDTMPGLVVAHGMAPLEQEPGAPELLSAFGARLYELFCEHIYRGDDVPELGDETAPHRPYALRFRDEFRRLHRAADYAPEHIQASDVNQIVDRLIELSELTDSGESQEEQ